MSKTNSRRGWGWRFRLATAGAAVGLMSATLVTGAAGPAATSASAASKYTFVLIPGLTVDPFYITMHNGAAAEAAKLGVTLKWVGDDDLVDPATDPRGQLCAGQQAQCPAHRPD